MSLNPPAPSSAPAATRRGAWRWLLRAAGVLVALGWGVLLVAWLTLHWFILPHIQEWRESIETRASRALGVPVRIGGIEVRSSGWVPSFELREVTLQGADGRPALRVPRVVAAVSARSLLAFELDFEQLLIEGAELDARRDAAGRISVAGLALDGPDRGEGSGLVDWFFRQREFVIRGGSLRWTDAQRAAPPLELTRVDLVLRNGLRDHAMRIDATPPAGWGDRFSVVGRFTQPLLARHGDWRRWRGSIYASLPHADVRALRRHVTLPFELSEGSGSLRGWFDVTDGEPRTATVDVALRDVTLRLAKGVDLLRFAEVEGRIAGGRTRDGFALDAQRFGFLTGDGLRWPRGALKVAWRQAEGQAPTGGSFSAERLDLGLIARIAAGVPLGTAVHRLLDEVRPQGVASRLEATWVGAVDAPSRYRVTGNLRGVSLAAKPAKDPTDIGRPGLRNADLQLDASDAGGSAQVDIDSGALELPGVFSDPLLPLTRLGARLAWTIEAGGSAPRISVQVKGARFANADARVELEGRWTTGIGSGVARGGRYPGRLELDGTLTHGVATRLHRYLPLGLSPGMRDYVRHAVQGGRVTKADFRIRGELWDFPFFDARRIGDATPRAPGEFRIDAKVDDVVFAYAPATAASSTGAAPVWPALTRTSGELVLDRNTLEIRNGRARIGEVALNRIGGRIEHLEGDATLALDAEAGGPLAEMLHVVNVSPISGWLGHVLDGASVGGAAEMKLTLGIPLAHPEHGSTARGSLLLANNELRFSPSAPVLGSARGRIDFTQQGFTVAGGSAKVYGGEANFQGGSQPDGSVRFTGQGTATAEGLRAATELGVVSRVASAFSGRTSYRVALGFGAGPPEISVSSNLVGLALNLPAPLDKRAEAALPMRYQTGPEPAGSPSRGGPANELVQFDLGHLVQARYVREPASEASRVLRGGIGVMDEAPAPAAGVAANVRLTSLDLGAWQDVFERLVEGRGTGGAGGSADAAGGIAATATVSADPGFAPDRIALRVQDLQAGGRRLTRLTANLAREGGLWRADLDADQLAGHVDYGAPVAGGAAAGGRVHARLSRLSLPKSDADAVSTVLDAPPVRMPALDVVVDDFELRGLRLGRVEIQATNRSGGPFRDGVRDAQRDWQLTRLTFKTPEAELVGSGLWAASGVPALAGTPSPRRMAIDFRLTVADSGALLDRLGTPKAIRGGKGQLAGHVAWLGSPFALDYPSLAGQVAVAVESGQFLKAEPGAARLLGVLSLQSLPRRLLLDFRDVFEQGFAFDSVEGDLRIARGVAETQNLRMRGVQATVLMEGSADLERETQNLRVVIVPEINAGTAALAYAAVNPAIGLGAFLAQLVLRKPLMAAGTREFDITGRWDDPKVAPAARRADTEKPAAAASTPAAHP